VASTWRHYEQAGLPDGLLVAADAVASFNPIYGHGMSVAALEMAKLGELLAARCRNAAAGAGGGGSVDLAGISQEFQQAITPIVQKVWDLSVGECVHWLSVTSRLGDAHSGCGEQG
jgi:2-polyprenyl-6-methoxyphenol hydroxylase-like FAD-dependent oxidoreductase